MHLAPLIQDLAVILGVAGLMSLLFQKIRQPVVLGYILAGMIVGPHTPPVQFVTDIPSIQTWAELGVIFLMFSLGLEFSFRKLARVGLSAGITAGIKVLFFIPLGFAVGKLLSWRTMDCIFLGAILSISSTLIILKALDELKLKTRRFAELIFAVLVVEDLIAILLLVGLTTIATQATISSFALLAATLKLVLVVGTWFIVGYFIVPRFMRYVGRVASNELLTLLSLGLCLGLVVLASHFHYSSALGAFIMGSILAESPIHQRIEARMESLRDLFGAIFFVSIGMLLDPKILWEYKGTIVILCAFTIFGKILIASFGALVSGQTFKTSLQMGFGLAQIGEFSFIIATLGLTLNVISPFIYPVTVAVSLVTTFATPYLIQFSGPIADRLEHFLPRRIRDMQTRYAIWSEARRTSTSRNAGFYSVLGRWFINGVTVSALFVACAEVLLPYLRTQDIGKAGALPAWGWIAAILFSSPFILGMFAFRKDFEIAKTPLLLLRILSVIWIGALSLEFFPARYVASVASLILMVLLLVFRKNLESSYHWLERHFLSSFEDTKPLVAEMPRLAPWDAHLVSIQVHPNAELSGKRLAEAQLRNRFGLNIVAIQRGRESMVAPKPDEFIFPRDELLVLGTDENIDKARPFLDGPSATLTPNGAIATYNLKHIELGPESRFRGLTIRNAGIRERFDSMVVGIERGGKRMMNPDSDLALQAGDSLWLVGSLENLKRLQAEIA